jgi:hypothetical protein
MSLARRCSGLFLILTLLWASKQLPAEVQSPEVFFGHQPGAEKRLIRWDGILRYMQELSRNSDRVRFFELGKTNNGNPFVLAVISSPENLQNLERYKQINHRLFDPRTIANGQEAQKLIADGKIFVLVTCSIHANEIGASQMSVEAAYRLAIENNPQVDAILKNVIFLLVPCLNPDGQIMVTDWYNKTVGTPYEDAPLPWLFHPYVGHDNNRDSFMFTQRETQLIGRVLYQDWLPAVWLDLHQMGSAGPRIFVMPAMDPINPNVDPLIYRNTGLLGFAQAAALERAGKEGIIYGEVYSYWWEGAMAWAGLWHNMIGLLTEVASAQIASTIEQQKADAPKLSVINEDFLRSPGPAAAKPIPPPVDLQPRLQYPQPWLGGKWSLRDIVEYELIATFGLLESSANLRAQLLESLYIVGKRQIESGRKGNPFAVVIPQDQHDRPTMIKMLQTLAYAGIEVHQAQRPFTADETDYPAGTYVILMSQPFRAYVKDMLEPQSYPASPRTPDGAPYPPYDITGWSLGMQMGVDITFVKKPFAAEMKKLDRIELPAGEMRGSSESYVLSHEPNNSLVAVNRLLKEGFSISWFKESVNVNGTNYAPGAILVRGGAGLSSAVAKITGSLGIDAIAANLPDADTIRIHAPRIGLYQPWGGNMDEGWTRWLLEQNEFPFLTVHPQDIRKGEILSHLDVLILPEMSPSQIMDGLTSKNVPEEFRGGIEKSGVKALRSFIDDGGTVIAMGLSSTFLTEELGAPYRDGLSSIRKESFFCPGSILRVLVDNSHPIGYGMPSEANGYFINSIALERSSLFSASRNSIVVRYPDSDILKSGRLRGESFLHGLIAAAEVRVGKGRMILLPLRVQHRAQSHGTFKLLFNGILTSATERPTSLETASEKENSATFKR